ncbi:MAG: acetylxylan esterase [Verrucomicrobiota bacterium]
MKRSFCTFLFLVPLVSLVAEPDSSHPKWDLSVLTKAPTLEEAQQARVDGVQSFFVEGLPYKGRPTRFYAYVGFPKDVSGKVPAIVLTHGGGGTAFSEWVKYWNAKGYAAIAMDNEGQVPVDDSKTLELPPNSPRPKSHWQTIDSLHLPWAGGPQRKGTFEDFDQPQEDQWMYHAVANTIRSVSYLASRPEVDASRIGIVGISWGSVICSVVGGVDLRLAFVVPQYIGGHLDQGNVWYAALQQNPVSKRWDPANFYPNPQNKAQWLWINGTNDKYGLPTMTTRSWRETGPNSWMTLLPTQGHGHLWTESGKNAVSEIYAFADSVTKGTPPLARILSTKLGQDEVTLTWAAVKPVVRAQLCYTTSEVPLITVAGEQRKDWEHVKYAVDEISLPAVKPAADGAVQASFGLPAGMKAGFVNLIDERGLSVSCEFLQVAP